MARPAHPSPDQAFSKPDRSNLPLATYLEQVTELLVRAVDARSRAILEDVVSTYFADSLELDRHLVPSLGTVYASDQRTYVETVLAFSATYSFRIRPTNVTALVDNARGQAKVFTTVLASGTPEATAAITNESVLIYHFERMRKENQENEEWLVVRMEFMRGPGA